jgi:hypothetical protein
MTEDIICLEYFFLLVVPSARMHARTLSTWVSNRTGPQVEFRGHVAVSGGWPRLGTTGFPMHGRRAGQASK